MLTIMRLTLALLAAYAVTVAGSLADPASRETRARHAARTGRALIDPCELRCEARALAAPGNPDPCHMIRTRRAGTRNGDPVHVPTCDYCGRRAVDIRSDAGDIHAARDLARVPTPRRAWLERP